MEKKGYIYILTNESFHKTNWVKIGYSTDVERRVKELSNTSVPLPFEIYATYEVPIIDGAMPDKQLHSLIHKLNPDLRITPDREFFEIEPWDAYDLLYAMAVIHGRLDKLKRYNKNDIGNEDTESSSDNKELDFFDGDENIKRIYNKFESIVLTEYPDLKVLYQKHYIAFRKGKKHNVLTVRTKKNSIEVALNAKLGTINLDNIDFVYDISNRMWTASQYAFKFDNETNIDIVKGIINQVYNVVK